MIPAVARPPGCGATLQNRSFAILIGSGLTPGEMRDKKRVDSAAEAVCVIEIGLSYVLYCLPDGTRPSICRQGQVKCTAPLTAAARSGVGQLWWLRNNCAKLLTVPGVAMISRTAPFMFKSLRYLFRNAPQVHFTYEVHFTRETHFTCVSIFHRAQCHPSGTCSAMAFRPIHAHSAIHASGNSRT